MLERIFRVMSEKKINKSLLAKMCGMNKSTIYTCLLSEENAQKAKLETIRAIADALGISLDYLMTGQEAIKDKDNFAPITRRRLHPILVKYNKLNAEGRERVEVYLNDLIASGNYDGNDDNAPPLTPRLKKASAN